MAIRAVTEEAAQVKTLVDEVHLGSREQAVGIGQIGKAITQMEQLTQTTAAHAQEGASAARELNAQSENLKDIVNRLTLLMGGGGTAGNTHPGFDKKRMTSAHHSAAFSDPLVTGVRSASAPFSR